jgi:uroporphyrinogen-III synthase
MRLGLARHLKHPIAQAVAKAGWEPVFLPLVTTVPVGEPPPGQLATCDAVLVLSPSGAQLAGPLLPPDKLVLCQGEGTLEALAPFAKQAEMSANRRAEGLWDLLRQRFPMGGKFILVRGERSRGYLEAMAQESSWRIEPWITHREEAAEPTPSLEGLDAVLALSPLQAELLAPLAKDLLRFAWGPRTGDAFMLARRPAHGTCDPSTEALTQILCNYLDPST